MTLIVFLHTIYTSEKCTFDVIQLVKGRTEKNEHEENLSTSGETERCYYEGSKSRDAGSYPYGVERPAKQRHYPCLSEASTPPWNHSNARRSDTVCGLSNEEIEPMMISDECFCPEKFVNQLRYLREMHGYTQNEVAEKLYVDRTTYTWYELGAVQPQIDTLVRLANLYGVSVDFLLGVSTERSVKELACQLYQFFEQYFQKMEERKH